MITDGFEDPGYAAGVEVGVEYWNYSCLGELRSAGDEQCEGEERGADRWLRGVVGNAVVLGAPSGELIAVARAVES